MMKLNKYGLSRDSLTEEDKRKIRRRCGFGCVICGSDLYEYHHFDPPFEEAKFHNPDGMTLLCCNHHGATTRGRLSLGSIKDANESPKCLQEGFSHGLLDLDAPIVFLGTVTVHANHIILEVKHEPILWIESPEVPDAPCRLSAIFHDKKGKEIARIDKNEWCAATGNWDVEIVGKKVIIRQKRGKYSLIMRLEPPGVIWIDRMNMCYKGYPISLGKDGALRAGTNIIKGVTCSGENGLSL